MGIYNRGELSFSRLITLFREKRLLIRKLFANQISAEFNLQMQQNSD